MCIDRQKNDSCQSQWALKILNTMEKKFTTLFPDILSEDIRHFHSPYRICPVGAHIDHQHGHITGFAIDHGVDLMYIPTESGIINLFSNDFEGQVLFTIENMPHKYSHWGRYVQAAIYALSKKYVLKNGIQGLIQGSLPVGGLSSSAAVLLCYVSALSDVNDIALSDENLIQIAFEAEREYIGLNLGTLDQSCEVLCKKNHLLYLDTKDGKYKLIPGSSTMPEFDILVFFSGLTRTLMNTNYNLRTDECKVAAFNLLAFEDLPNNTLEDTRLRNVDASLFDKWEHKLPDSLAKRTRHYMTEFSRVEQAVDAYALGDINRLGEIMFESGDSSITNWEAGCPEMIELFNIMQTTEGIYGGRFSGAGFKGCCIAISKPEYRDFIVEKVSKEYLTKFPELKGKYSAHVCKTADGVRRIK